MDADIVRARVAERKERIAEPEISRGQQEYNGNLVRTDFSGATSHGIGATINFFSQATIDFG